MPSARVSGAHGGLDGRSAPNAEKARRRPPGIASMSRELPAAELGLPEWRIISTFSR